jgi:hypothetical protein
MHRGRHSQNHYTDDTPKLVEPSPKRLELARKYFVEDLPVATTPGTRFHSVLEDINQGKPLPEKALLFLQEKGIFALQQLAQNEISYEAFSKMAASEQHNRKRVADAEIQNAETEQLKKIEQDKAREAVFKVRYEHERQRAEEARRQRESDPKYQAKIKNQKLRERYEIDSFIEKEHFSRLMNILHRLDEGNRLTVDDQLWLTRGDGQDYFSEKLKAAFHEREAEFFKSEFKRTNDPWNAVNASSHYRKCDQPKKAHELLLSISTEKVKLSKLKSAILTTHGGAMRDLKRFDEALKFGDHAHNLTPKDYRPCTLLGAVNIEIGNYQIGSEWYQKAEERGASVKSIDNDLRAILSRADKNKREEIKAFLLKDDPERYKWLLKF